MNGRKRLAGGRQGQPVHPEPDVRSGREARQPRRVLPRTEPRRQGHAHAVRRARPDRAGVPRPRRAQLACSIAQGLEGCFLFPTLGVGMEESAEARSGCSAGRVRARSTAGSTKTGASPIGGRIFGAPYFTLVDVDAAVRQLDWALARGARLICMRAAPIAHAQRQQSRRPPALRSVLGARERGRHHARLSLRRRRL